MHFRARSCKNLDCRLRFPVRDESPLGASCPVCGAPTEFRDEAYESHEVKTQDPRPASRSRIRVLLDNVRSLSNVGSIFRTADGVGIEHIYLGGFTPGPEHPKLRKTALGAESSVPSSRHRDPWQLAHELARASNCRLWAIEGGERSELLNDLQASDFATPPDHSTVLVFGHEVSGVDPRIMQLCERVVAIPMLGTKGSLNVGVAVGIVAYTLRFSGAGAASGSLGRPSRSD